MDWRPSVDTISDNAATGAMVVGGRPVKPDAVDLRWVSAILHQNQTVGETGVAAGSWTTPPTASTGWPTKSPRTGIY